MGSPGGLENVLIGAVLAIVSALGVRLWQYERDRWTGRVDWFCEALDEAADLGVQYWVEAGAEGERHEDRKREIQILGYQIKLDGGLETFIDKLRPEDVPKVRTLLSNFHDALTGGAFQTQDVQADEERARELQLAASELYLCVRKAVDSRLQVLPRRFSLDSRHG